MNRKYLVILFIAVNTCWANILFAQHVWQQYRDSVQVQRKSLQFDGQNRLWCIQIDMHALPDPSAGHVARFDGVSWHPYTSTDGLTNDTLFSLTRDREGRIWAAGRRQVCYFDNVIDKWKSIPVYQDSISNTRDFTDIVCDSSGSIWVASIPRLIWMWNGSTPDYYPTGEVMKWDGKSWTKYDLRALDHVTGLTTGGTVQDMAVAPNGDIWTADFQYYSDSGLTGGLHHFDGSNWSLHTLGGVPYQGSSGTPVAVFCDKEDIVWVGHQFFVGKAIEWFDGSKWWSSTNSRFIDGEVSFVSGDHTIKSDPLGRVWVNGVLAHDGGQCVFISDNHGNVLSEFTTTLYPTDTSLMLGPVSMAFSQDGSVWIANAYGISVLRGAMGVKGKEESSEVISSHVWPNPLASYSMLSYSLPSSGFVNISIVDPAGRIVRQLRDGEWESAGDHTLNINNLSSGSYFVRITLYYSDSKTYSATIPITVLR